MSESTENSRLATLLDERAIERLLYRYATAIDWRQFDELEKCFTADASIRMSVAGQYASPSHYRQHAESNLAALDATHHSFTGAQIRVDGEFAVCSSYYQAQHVRSELRPNHQLMIGGWVRDTLVRQADGWRISDRRGTAVWFSGNPAVIGRSELHLPERPWRSMQ